MLNKILLSLIALLLASVSWCQAGPAASSKQEEEQTSGSEDLFFSKEDGKFDISGFLSHRYGFIPMPIIITEPAVGYGGGVNLMFLHDSLGSALERKSPPSITGVAIAGTENGTLAGGAYHLGFWRHDTIRTTSAAGAVDVNADFYLRNRAVSVNLKAWFAYQELMFRIADSDFFTGANYIYGDFDSERNNRRLQQLDRFYDMRYKLGALGAFIQYDTRNSIFTPSRGVFAKTTVRRFDDCFGGNQNFWRYGGKLFWYVPAGSRVNLGLRVEGEGVYGNRVPFFSNPFIPLRGIPSMRYQGQYMLVGEAELRWEIITRWQLVFFFGAGKVFGDEYRFNRDEGVVKYKESIYEAELHPAGGGGFRYELARRYGLWAGLDFATSDAQSFAFYITVGSAWMAF